MKLDFKELNKSSLVIRLERIQNDLLKMKVTLSSYICEPRTQSFFERFEQLKQQLENLTKVNTKIINSLSNQEHTTRDGLVEQAKQHFQEFYSLQEEVSVYTSGVRNH